MLSRIFLAITSIIFSLLICEVFLRITGLAPNVVRVAIGRYQLSSDPILGYVPIPGLKNPSERTPGFDYPDYEANSLGFRSPDYSKRRSSKTFRVAVLGDSLASGLWINHYKDTFPAVLEENLKTMLLPHGITPEVLNFGVVGYNTRQEEAMLRNFALSYSPDLVLVQYCLNDRERNDGALLWQLTNTAKNSSEFIAALENTWIQRSAIARFIQLRSLPAKPEITNAKITKLSARQKLLVEDSVEESIAKLGETSKTSRVPLVLSIFPRFGDLNNYSYGNEHNTISQLATKAGITVVDLLEPFKICSSGGKLSFDEYHPNILGHRCAGEALAAELAPKASGIVN